VASLIAILGGLRISEVMNLEFNDITFLNNGSVKNSEKPFISVSDCSKLILPRAGVLRH